MPRTAADRVFGWREAGIVRVLTGADPVEVKRALDSLGIQLDLDKLIKLQEDHLFSQGIRNAIDRLANGAFNLAIEQLQHHHRGSGILARAKANLFSYRQQRDFAQRLDFAHGLALEVLIIRARRSL